MTSTCDIVNSHAFPLRENPPFTRQNDCVHINALKTGSPRTVRALCRGYWGGPHQVLNKDCWWEMWSHPWCNYTSTMHPFGKIERKKSGLVLGRNFWAGTSDHGSTVRLPWREPQGKTLAAFRNVELEVTPKASRPSVRINTGTACAIGLSWLRHEESLLAKYNQGGLPFLRTAGSTSWRNHCRTGIW